LLFVAISTKAQKLPNLQPSSLQVPLSIKIDGNATEWGNKYQAYNHNTDVAYTIANDAQYLYFVIRATNTEIIKKILKGGITISANAKEKSFFGDAQSFCFPFINPSQQAPLFSTLDEVKEDLKSSFHQKDSLVKAFNNYLLSVSKDIKVAHQRDSVLSIYNDKQLLVAGALNNNGALIYEFRIPLSILNMAYQKSSTLYYNIKLTGQAALPKIRPIGVGVVAVQTVEVTALSLYMPTDFWGTYQLF